MFTQEELKNIIALIALAPIKGSDAYTVALLQEKLSKLLVVEPVTEKKETKPAK